MGCPNLLSRLGLKQENTNKNPMVGAFGNLNFSGVFLLSSRFAHLKVFGTQFWEPEQEFMGLDDEGETAMKC